MNQPDIAYKTFLHWLLLAGLAGFAVFLSWDLGVLQKIIQADVTRISLFILSLLLLGSLHCAWRSWYIASQARMLCDLTRFGDMRRFPAGVSVAQDYLTRQLKAKTDAENPEKSLLAEVMSETLRGSHQVGWFISGLMIKLGLLGTVIGFVLMLSSVSGLETLDISDIKQLMQQMTQGMGVAMNTTLVGLVSSMLLGIQYLLLDRHADQLVLQTVIYGQDQEIGA